MAYIEKRPIVIRRRGIAGIDWFTSPESVAMNNSWTGSQLALARQGVPENVNTPTTTASGSIGAGSIFSGNTLLYIAGALVLLALVMPALSRRR